MSVSPTRCGASEWWHLPRQKCLSEQEAEYRLYGNVAGTYFVWDLMQDHSMLSYVNTDGKIEHQPFGYDKDKAYVRLGIYWGTVYTSNSGVQHFSYFLHSVVGPNAHLLAD